MSYSLLLLQTSPSESGKFSNFLAAFWPVLVPVLLGLAAVYLLLPRVRRRSPILGFLLGSAALVCVGVLLVRTSAALPETILFYAFAAVAVVGGALLVTHHNPVYAALAFALVVLSTCGLFLLLAAPFLMAATVIIYAGAIIVTFLFVIMLAQQAGLSSADRRSREPFLASVAGFLLLGAILCVLQKTYDTSALAPYLSRLQKASNATSEEEIRQGLGDDPEAFLKKFHAAVERGLSGPASGGSERVLPHPASLASAILSAEEAVNTRPMDLVRVNEKLGKILDLGLQIQATQGSLAPAAGLPLSSFSGRPANRLPPPLDARGRPKERLPAENVASLGRSLFSDYLIAVELAGTLLLVATIGAIAIAARRVEGRA